ncbi:acetylxylan esterase [bacterium]|nr:acetylxylan esterase [bacterium]
MKRLFVYAALTFLCLGAPLAAAEPQPGQLDVLPAEDFFADQAIMLSKHFQRQPQERIWQRDVELARIRSEDDWQAYREKLLANYKKALGLPFPERTDLAAECTGVLDRGSYRIEKIVYQSQPGIMVTANLYVPQDGSGGKYPGIVFPCGHWHNAKAAIEYHSCALDLVLKGFVVLLFDPIGQGERCDYFKPDGSLVTEEPVIEHTLLANPLFLMGRHLMTLRLWDTVRGIDYLQSRPEVDPERIGITGNSGGGTVTLHLVPLEDRIKVAVPDGTVGAPDWDLGQGGIGDGEQNLPGRVPLGISHADLMLLAFPRPYRLIIESRGGSRTGTRQSWVEANWLYESLGQPGRMDLVETEWPHGLFKFSREKTCQWFLRWFYGRETGWEEPELKTEKEADLWCSKSGQILRERGKSIQVYIDEQAQKILPVREAPGKGAAFESYRDDIRKGAAEALNNPPLPEAAPRMVPLGEVELEGIKVEKFALYSEDDIYLPVLMFKPPSKDKFPLVVLADSRGKASDGGALAVALARAGVGVAAVDLRGYGETSQAENSERDQMGGLMAQTLGAQASLAYDGLALGRSVFAMRVYDIQRTLQYLRTRPELSGLALAGRGGGGPLALYAATLEKGLAGVLLDSSLVAWRELTRPGVYSYNFIDFLPGALKYSDFPQLAAACAPARVRLVNALDARMEPLSQKAAESAWAFTGAAYRAQGAGGAFAVASAATAAATQAAWLDWAAKAFKP